MTIATRYIGTCPVCEGEYRLHRERMVHHGYKRPGHGSIEGDCPGVGYPPYEVSTEGTEAYRVGVLGSVERMTERLAWLNSGEVTELNKVMNPWDRHAPPKFKRLTPGDGYEFRNELDDRVRELGYRLNAMARELERCDRLIATWKPRPIRTLEESIERESAAKAERAAVRAQEKAVRDAKKQATRDKVSARGKREADFISRYRADLLIAARDGDKSLGHVIWKRMHREAKKEVSSGNRFLMGFVKDMKIDEALFDLGLAKVEGDYLSYADETGWMIPARRR